MGIDMGIVQISYMISLDERLHGVLDLLIGESCRAVVSLSFGSKYVVFLHADVWVQDV